MVSLRPWNTLVFLQVSYHLRKVLISTCSVGGRFKMRSASIRDLEVI